MTAKSIILGGALAFALYGCGGGAMQTGGLVGKINYVCAYSGLFKFADGLAASVIPVPGVALGVDLVNAGVDNICLHPERIAATEATVTDLIARFKAARKM